MKCAVLVKNTLDMIARDLIYVLLVILYISGQVTWVFGHTCAAVLFMIRLPRYRRHRFVCLYCRSHGRLHKRTIEHVFASSYVTRSLSHKTFPYFVVVSSEPGNIAASCV